MQKNQKEAPRLGLIGFFFVILHLQYIPMRDARRYAQYKNLIWPRKNFYSWRKK